MPSSSGQQPDRLHSDGVEQREQRQPKEHEYEYVCDELKLSDTITDLFTEQYEFLDQFSQRKLVGKYNKSHVQCEWKFQFEHKPKAVAFHSSTIDDRYSK